MGLTATLVGAFSGGTMVLFMRSFRKAPYFTKPWEIALGMGSMAYLANVAARAEFYYEGLARQMLLDKMSRNQGKLDEKYVALLGTSYDRIMGEAAKS